MRYILFVILICFSGSTLYASVPVTPFNEKITPKKNRLTFRDLNRLTSKKLTLKQKLQVLLLQYRLRHPKKAITEKQGRQATISMILGILSLVLLFTPVGIVAIPAAILGLTLGIISLQGNSNPKGLVGVITSGLTLVLLLIAVIVVASMVY